MMNYECWIWELGFCKW